MIRGKGSKKGATLIELIVAIIIIAIVVGGTVTAVVFSQQSVLTDSTEENASMEAQSIADELLTEMSNRSFELNEDAALHSGSLSSVGEANYIYVVDEIDFPLSVASGGMKQFTIVKDSKSVLTADGKSIPIEGTKIIVAIYHSGGGYIEYEAFAPEKMAEN